MSSCGERIDHTLSRLSARWYDLKLNVPPESKGLQEQIENKMKDLRNRLWRGKESEVMKQLDLATRYLDDISDSKTGISSDLMNKLLEVFTKADEKASASTAKDQREKPDEGVTVVEQKLLEVSTKAADETTSASASTGTDQWEEPDEGVTVVEQKLQKSPAWAHLQLVVDSLDPLLKNCLFTLTVFPPNVDIKKRLLLHWWMGEAFVKCIEEGKRCFDQLVEKGLVVPVGKRHCGKHHYCRVQSWLRPLLVAVSNANGFLDYDKDGKPSDDYSFSPRLCLRAGRELAPPRDGMADSRLRTVYNVGNLQPEFPPNWLLNKKDLTTLQLGRWQKDDKKRPPLAFVDNEFLWGLRKNSGLRYLSLRGISRLEMLPRHSVEKAHKLVVLDLRACSNLEKLPTNLGDARRLQFLDVSDCTLLDQMPKTLASLSALEVLKGFVVCDYGNTDSCQIGDLLKLTKLRKLSISTSREFNVREVAKLGELINRLTSLTIAWAVATKKENPAKSKAEKETAPARDRNLKSDSPSKLEKLDLRCFNEERLPKWIVPDKLTNLKKLYVTGGMLKSFEGAQEEWPVKVLRVRFLSQLEDRWKNLITWFPHLNCVQKSECCDKLSDWPCDEEGYWEKGNQSEVEESSDRRSG